MRIKFSTRVVDMCIEGTSIDEDSADNLIKGDLSIDSDEAKCVLKCFFNKVGFVNKDGEPQNEFIASTLIDTVALKTETLERITGKCFKIKGEYDCEAAYKVRDGILFGDVFKISQI